MAEGTLNSLIANRLALQQSNPELFAELESRMPIVGNHPNTTAEVQGMPNPDVVQSMAQSFAGAQVPAPAVPNVPQQGQSQSQLGALVSQMLEDLNKDNAKKAKPIGPDLMGNGGILGSGISPSTALMYALGGLVTSRLPQQQALAMTMKIGQMPQEYEAQKHQIAQSQIQSILGGINAGTADENLKTRQLELGKKLQETKRKEEFIGGIDLSKGSLTAAEKLKGVFAGVLPASILSTDVDYVDSVDSDGNAIKVVTNKMTGQPVVDEQGRPTIFKQPAKKEAAPRQIGMNDLKIFADTGVRGPTLPPDLTRTAAQLAVSEEQKRQVGTAGNKAGAVAANTPASPEGQEKILNFDNFVNLLDNIYKGFDPKFYGMVRGRTYSLARQGMAGFAKPTDQEVKSRADHENAKSILVLVRSGAAAAEPEFARLGGVIGEATDDPDVLRTSIKNMLKQAQELQAERKKLINTPKKDIAANGYTASQAARIDSLQKQLIEAQSGGKTSLPPGAREKVE